MDTELVVDPDTIEEGECDCAIVGDNPEDAVR